MSVELRKGNISIALVAVIIILFSILLLVDSISRKDSSLMFIGAFTIILVTLTEVMSRYQEKDILKMESIISKMEDLNVT